MCHFKFATFCVKRVSWKIYVHYYDFFLPWISNYVGKFLMCSCRANQMKINFYYTNIWGMRKCDGIFLPWDFLNNIKFGKRIFHFLWVSQKFLNWKNQISKKTVFEEMIWNYLKLQRFSWVLFAISNRFEVPSET